MIRTSSGKPSLVEVSSGPSVQTENVVQTICEKLPQRGINRKDFPPSSRLITCVHDYQSLRRRKLNRESHENNISRALKSLLLVQATENKIRDFFSKKGSVTDVSLKFTPEGKFRRFGFIGFASSNEAEEAQKYFDKTFMGTYLAQLATFRSMDALQ